MADLFPAALWRPEPSADDGPIRLGHLDSLGKGDLLAWAADRLAGDSHPKAQAFSEWARKVLHEHIFKGEPIGRASGLEPPAGLTLRRAALQAERNRLLHIARAARPEWAGASAARAAQLIDAAWQSYASTAWPRDRKRETAPAAEPAASFWRLCRLEAEGGPRVVGEERIYQLFREADGPSERPEQLTFL
ncbi:hypothetical protein [Cereibacter azotoformans]|uniref:hypothetical protein n=1 Tax=Cereibacter azotoformans TaxID=43057 RepID=UPI001F1F01CE|nr:hypothetical protein [Cereibacter azotoformans]